MSGLLKVKCRSCGLANSLKMGRIYTMFKCEQCGSEIDLDETLTFELVPEDRPVKLIRDTVTVGFRPRNSDDKISCPQCGSTADVEFEDVLGERRKCRCSRCGHSFEPPEEAAEFRPLRPNA